jgi:hypothetical protein
MVKYKSEWKDVRAVFWLGLVLGFLAGILLLGVWPR